MSEVNNPTPWQVRPSFNGDGKLWVLDADNTYICEVADEETAQRIVDGVNRPVFNKLEQGAVTGRFYVKGGDAA